MRSYWDAVGILLANTLGFRLALLEGMLVLKLRSHIYSELKDGF